MATIQSSKTPGTRIEVGNSVLAAAKTVHITPVKKRFEQFKKVHGAFRAADAKVKVATEKITKQQERVAEADVDQDAAVLDLAGSLAADGLPRLNPFATFGASPPAALCKLGYGAEAEQVLKLEKAILKHPGASPATHKRAKKAAAAAKKVLVELKAIPKLEASRAEARAAREALEQAWETAFAALKRAARAAADDGAPDLFAALFDRAPKPPKKKPAAEKAKPAPPA